MAEDDTHRWLPVLARYPDFRRLFAGSSISLLGSSVTAVALPLTAVVDLRASPAQMGLLGAAALLPQLLLGLPAGVWVDRAPYRRTLIAADLARAPLLGAIPLLAALGALRIWQLYPIAVLAGVADLFDAVTAQSFTPRLVPRERLLPANSALMISNTTVATTGSALAGLLVSLLTAPIAIAADAASFLLSALCRSRIRDPGPPAPPADGAARRDRRLRVPGPPAPGPPGPPPVGAARRDRCLRGDVADGLRAVFGHPVLRTVTIAATVGALAGQVQNVVLVLYLVRDLHLRTGLIGVAVAAGVAVALLASRITRRVGPGPAFALGMLAASAAGLLLAAAAGPLAPAVVIAAQLLRGAGPSLYGVNQQTLRQTLIEPAMLARANATWRFLVYGTQSLGALTGGLLGSAAGLRGTLVISGCVMLLGTAIAYLSPPGRVSPSSVGRVA